MNLSTVYKSYFVDDRICIIGKNSKGESTLLKLITNDLTRREGEVTINNKTEIGYFGQMNIDRLQPNLSIYEEMQDAAPEINQTTICQVCGNMMFSGGLSNKKIAVLSGGEKSWVMLGKSILKTSNLLLLDELTNHLDLKSCESLLGAIKSFPGSVLIMTHR